MMIHLTQPMMNILMEIIIMKERYFMSMKKETLNDRLYKHCNLQLNLLERKLKKELSPHDRLKAATEINVYNHLLDYKTYKHFISLEELIKYVQDRVDIILSFYEN
jgi:hypothetical protein